METVQTRLSGSSYNVLILHSVQSCDCPGPTSPSSALLGSSWFCVWFFFPCYFSSSCVALLLAHLVILFLPCPAVHFSSWYSLLTVKCVHSCVDFYLMHLSILVQLSQAFADVRAAASMLALLGISSGWGGSSNLKIGDRNLNFFFKKNPTMHRRCGTLLVLQQSVV